MKRFFTSLLVLSVVAVFSHIHAQTTDKIAKGIVFFDEDGDGIKGEYEEGMNGIVVSDGFSVVKTDSKGRFEITLSPRSRFVTVSTPSGYANVGSYYADVRKWVSGEDTSEHFGDSRVKRGLFYQKGEGIYFPLKSVSQNNAFIQMGDIEERTYRDWYGRLSEFISNHPMDFMIMTGDICYEKGLKLNSEMITDATMGTRVVFTIGNHDFIKGYKDYLGNDYGEKMFEDGFGPSWYSFNVGALHFIVTPMMFGQDAKPSFTKDDIFNWIDKDIAALPEGTPIVIFNHATNKGWDLTKYNTKAYIYGHNHNNYYLKDTTGIEFFCTMAPNKAGVDHSPSSLRMFTFDEKGTLANKLYYTPLTNQFVVKAVPHQGDSVDFFAIAYDAASDASNVRIVGKEGMKPLEKINDMVWGVRMSAREKDLSYIEKEYTAGVLFSDGEVSVSKVDLRDDFVWVKHFPAKVFLAKPIVTQDKIYISCVDYEAGRDCGIYALDKESGEPIWFFHTQSSVNNNIVCLDGVLYAVDQSFNVYAVDAVSGSQIWHKQIEKSFFPLNSEGVCIDNGKMYVGSNKFLFALDIKDGSLIWRNGEAASGVNNVSTKIVGDGVLMTNAYWISRNGYDASTGALLWKRNEMEDRYSCSTPIFVDGHFIYTTQNSIREIDPHSGELINSCLQKEQFSTSSVPLLADSIIVVGTSDLGVGAYSRKTFSKVWGFQTNPALIYTVPYSHSYEKTVECNVVRYGDNVIFGANDGFLYCLGLQKGEYKWRIEIGLPILAEPVIEGDIMYVVDFAGTLYKIDLTKVK